MKSSFIRIASAVSLALIFSQPAYATGNDNPTGVTGQYNGSITTAGSYDPYTGNATRTITDLSVTGAVGAYPLAWTRFLNTRNITGPRSLGKGGWTHSYDWHIYLRTSNNPPHWNDETEDYYEGPDAVVYYPDGRQVWFEGEPGYDYVGAPEQDTSVLLKHVGGGNYDLYLPDGGRVQFELGPYLDGTVTRTGLLAKRIVDPYGVVTTFTRDSAGRLLNVTEQAGRYLEIEYTNQLITKVRAFASEGNLIETVTYVYGHLGAYLTQVNYDDGTHAFYTYQASNNSGTDAALIRTCDDVRYAGPMGKIEYVFMPVGPGIDFGQLKGEKYPGMTALVSQVTYPAYNCCAWNDPAGFVRTETRADGATRKFQYGIGGGELTSFSDFQDKWSFTERIVEPGNHLARRINTDARTNPTTIEKTFHGKTNRLIHPDGTYQAFVYERVHEYPYYVLIRGDELGRNTYYTRDTNHRVTKIWYGFDPTNHNAYPTEEFTYNALGQILTHKLTSGGTEVFEYDHGLNNRGLKTKHTDPLGNVTRYQYYQSGANTDRVWKVTDARNNTTTYDYNLRGQVTRVTHQDNNYTQSGYNPDGTLAWTADENHPGAVNDPNQRTRYIYDEYKRVVSVTNPMNETATNIYAPWNGAGHLSHTTSTVYQTHSPMGKQVHHDYDANLRRTITRAGVTADDAWTFFEYDAVGNLTKTTDPRSNVTVFGYDNRNRQTSISNALTQTTRIEYDALNKRKETRPDNAFRSWDYEPVNPMNRLVQTIDWRMSTAETPRTTSYARDVNHRTESITDAKGAVYTFTFDELHRKISATYPPDTSGGQRTGTWQYDPAGNMKEYHNPAGQKQFLSYDERNRLQRSSWDGGAGPDIVTNYDPASRVTSVTTNNGETVVAFGYDHANRKISEEQTLSGYPPRRVETARDPDGNRANLHVPGFYLIHYDYNQRNELFHIRDGNNNPFATFTRDAAGNVTNRRTDWIYANGVNYGYDALNRPVTIDQGNATHVFQHNHYQYDKVGREVATWRGEDGKGERFYYNVASQLTRAEYGANNVWTGSPSNWNRFRDYTYTPDLLNWSAVNDNGYMAPFGSNAMNQYTTVNGSPVGYDANFNISSFGGNSFIYDAQNRVVSGSMQATYDGLGRCVRRTVGGTTLLFTYDDWNPILEWGPGGDWRAWNIYGGKPDEILARYDANHGPLIYRQDRQGSVTFLLNGSNQIIEKYTYDAYGRPAVSNADGSGTRSWSNYGNRFMFTGREYLAELGLYDYRHRIYDPGIGRFLQTDPIGFDAGDMNLFRYVADDPVNRSDPAGLAERFLADFRWTSACFADSGNSFQGSWEEFRDLFNPAPGDGGQGSGSSVPFSGVARWEKPTGNWNDPKVSNHVVADGSMGNGDVGQTHMSRPKVEAKPDGSLSVKSDLNWFVEDKYKHTNVSLAEVNDHVRSWRKWQTESTWGDGYVTVKNFKATGSAKAAAATLEKRLANEWKSEDIRQRAQYHSTGQHHLSRNPSLKKPVDAADIERAVRALP